MQSCSIYLKLLTFKNDLHIVLIWYWFKKKLIEFKKYLVRINDFTSVHYSLFISFQPTFPNVLLLFCHSLLYGYTYLSFFPQAFPCISTGIYGKPNYLYLSIIIVYISLFTVNTFLSSTHILICTYLSSHFSLFKFKILDQGNRI